MPYPATLNDLHVALKSTDPTAVVDASWEAFDVGLRIAHAVIWEDDFEDIVALSAAQACAAARALLPLPRNGRPLPLPEPPEDSVKGCSAVLHEVHTALTSLSQASDDSAGEPLRTAAVLAKDAAQALDAASR